MRGAKRPGVACPECGAASRVSESRLNRLSLAGGIRRRRKCLACAHRFTTDEEPRPETPEAATAFTHAAELGRLYLALGDTDRRSLLRIARAFQPEAPRGHPAFAPTQEAHAT